MLLGEKVFQVSLLAIVVLTGGLFVVDAVSAQVPSEDSNADDLIVEFNPNDPLSDKLFNVVNFLPGDSESSSAYVENNSEGVGEKIIAIKAINVHNDIIAGVDERFGDALDLTIREDSDLIFDGTLTEFFDDGEFVLSNLDNGADTTYDFLVIFRESVSEEYYQGKSLGFDIEIGFQGGESISDTGNSGGGSSDGLIIKDVEVYDITENSVRVKWWTNYNATSQIVYCKEKENCSLDLSDNTDTSLLYGYNYTTSEENAPASRYGVTYHEIIVMGLQEGTTYDFRCISRASFSTMSRNYNFRTLAVGDDENESGDDVSDSTARSLSRTEIREDYGASVEDDENIRGPARVHLLGRQEGRTYDSDPEKIGLIPSVNKVFNSANNFIGSVLGLENVKEVEEGNIRLEQGGEIGDSFKGSYSNVLLSVVLLFLAIIIILYFIYHLNKRTNRKA